MSDVTLGFTAQIYDRITSELQKVIVGQSQTIRLLLVSIFTRGHCLLIGVPGLAKTLLAESLSKTLDLGFGRIQFTPDLMPADIIGSELIQEVNNKLSFEYQPGPVFTNLLLADEINRTPPKTQSALLEAMQERKVTVASQTRLLPDPFVVMATQNPIEQEGTYPLPEAQLDRFMFSLIMDYPAKEEESEIVRRTTIHGLPEPSPVVSAHEVLQIQQMVMAAPVSDHVIDYAVALARATRPKCEDAVESSRKYVEWGAGPRASQCLIMGAKAIAILDGRIAAEVRDVQAVAVPVLQHRIVTNYSATGSGVNARQIVEEILDSVQENEY
jgi:MoxR-like ATPase